MLCARKGFLILCLIVFLSMGYVFYRHFSPNFSIQVDTNGITLLAGPWEGWTYERVVNPMESWQDTGLTLKRGEPVDMRVYGRVSASAFIPWHERMKLFADLHAAIILAAMMEVESGDGFIFYNKIRKENTDRAREILEKEYRDFKYTGDDYWGHKWDGKYLWQLEGDEFFKQAYYLYKAAMENDDMRRCIGNQVEEADLPDYLSMNASEWADDLIGRFKKEIETDKVHICGQVYKFFNLRPFGDGKTLGEWIVNEYPKIQKALSKNYLLPFSGPSGYDRTVYIDFKNTGIFHSKYSLESDPNLTVRGVPHNTLLGLIVTDFKEGYVLPEVKAEWRGERECGDHRYLTIKEERFLQNQENGDTNGSGDVASHVVLLNDPQPSFTPRADGRLFLAVNDAETYRNDNAGHFIVRISTKYKADE